MVLSCHASIFVNRALNPWDREHVSQGQLQWSEPRSGRPRHPTSVSFNSPRIPPGLRLLHRGPQVFTRVKKRLTENGLTVLSPNSCVGVSRFAVIRRSLYLSPYMDAAPSLAKENLWISEFFTLFALTGDLSFLCWHDLKVGEIQRCFPSSNFIWLMIYVPHVKNVVVCILAEEKKEALEAYCMHSMKSGASWEQAGLYLCVSDSTVKHKTCCWFYRNLIYARRV